MYKMIKVFNQVWNDEVKSAEYSMICEFEEFAVEEKYKDILVNYCKVNNLQYGAYTIVKFENNEPKEVAGQLFYHSEDDKFGSFLDVAEWNERVYASLALGRDIVISDNTRKVLGITGRII